MFIMCCQSNREFCSQEPFSKMDFCISVFRSMRNKNDLKNRAEQRSNTDNITAQPEIVTINVTILIHGEE